MSHGLTRPIFDWLGRPFAELLEQLDRLRQAAREQVEVVRRVIAERDALLSELAAEPVTEQAGSPEARLSTRQLDLRVRSAMIREGSSTPIRQEMAEMVSRLGMHRQLDPVSNQAYELIAAAESLLALVRGDGWLFARRELFAMGEEVDQAIAAYRDKLDLTQRELEEKASRLARSIERHLRFYQLARFGFVALLFLGPLIGLWSGMQLAEKTHRDPLTIRVPGAVEDGIELLSRGERLVQPADAPLSTVPWLDSSPDEQVAQLVQDLQSDQRWSASLCKQLAASRDVDGASLVLSVQCNELLVRNEEVRRGLVHLGEVLREQESLRSGLVTGMVSSLSRQPRQQSATPLPTAPPPEGQPITRGGPEANP